MKKTDSLRRRISAAYLRFAVVASLFFAVIAAVAVEGIEVRLVDERLQEVADWAAPRHAGGLPVEMPAGISFHHSGGIPKSLRGLPPGTHEVTVDGVDLHVLASSDAEGPFVVVDHDSEYEKIEIVVYSLFGIGFLGFMGCSLALGRFVANRVVDPITELSRAVNDGSAVLPLQDRPDELGLLARAFAGHTQELHQFLERERHFTGDMSHEMRTPLTVISGAAEVLMEQARGEPALHAPAERIYRAAIGASEVTSTLLRLARSPDQLEWGELSAASLAQGEILRSQPLVAGKPVALRFAGGEDFAIHGVRELAQAAIGNLVRNACQYTASGSVEVRLEGRSIVVEDTGPGLPAAAQARLDTAGTGAGAGTAAASGQAREAGPGLGLGLARRICEHLGARLRFQPLPSGSRLSIEFPAQADLTRS